MTPHVVYGILALLVGVLAYRLAEQKVRALRAWMVASVFFLFPLLALALLPAKGVMPAGRPQAR